MNNPNEGFFANQGFWAIVGALLGFILGLAGNYFLQKLAENRRKKQLRTAARNIIGIEIIHNLDILEHIDEDVQKTIEETNSLYIYPLPPRDEIFNKMLYLPSISVMENYEQKLIMEIFSQLNMVAREFALWPNKIKPFLTATSIERKSVSGWLLYANTLLELNLLRLLCQVCSREKKMLQRNELQKIQEKLHKLREDDYKFAYLFKSSQFETVKHKINKKCKYLVVWEHDNKECPLEVIELRPFEEIPS